MADSLLPPNASALEKGLEQATAGDLLAVPVQALATPQACPPGLLPFLAWALSVDEWNAAWALPVRREVVARAIPVHRRKGTLAAVREALSAFGASVSIREWWQIDPPGEPGSFSIVLAVGEIEGTLPNAAYIDAAIRQVIRAKPLSRPFEFTLSSDAAGVIGVAAVSRPAIYARLDMTA